MADMPVDGLSNEKLRHHAQEAVNQLPLGYGRNMLQELVTRFSNYTKINTQFVHLPADIRGFPRTEHAEALTAAVGFYERTSQSLSQYGLFDISKIPLPELQIHLNGKLNELFDRPVRLTALIGEIYGAGGVKFNYKALPDEVRNFVTQTLKDRGMLRE